MKTSAMDQKREQAKIGTKTHTPGPGPSPDSLDTLNGINVPKPQVQSPTTVARKMTSVQAYVIALRPWSFTASLIPVFLGCSLAYKSTASFNIWILLNACVIALSVHAAGNLVNTYYDYKKGVDNKKSDDRTLVDQLLTANDVVTMSGILYLIGCVGFVVMVLLSPTRMEHLALVYFGGLSGSFLYTGGLGLKYIALGDILILLTFGPVTVLFAYLSQGGALAFMPILYSLPLTMNTEAILHSNNTRDMDSDKEAGIITLAILIGRTGSYALFSLLIFGPYIIFVMMAVNISPWFAMPFSTIIIVFEFERNFRSGKLDNMPQSVAKLNFLLGILYIAACLLAKKLPGL